MGKVSAVLLFCFSSYGATVCFLQAAGCSGAVRSACVMHWLFGCCERGSCDIRFALLVRWLSVSRARLWRCLACAICFGSGQSSCARSCKRSAQVPNNGLTRRCTRPPTACALVASSRRSGFRRRVSLVVLPVRAAFLVLQKKQSETEYGRIRPYSGNIEILDRKIIGVRFRIQSDEILFRPCPSASPWRLLRSFVWNVR